jgi:hypothetical protein
MLPSSRAEPVGPHGLLSILLPQNVRSFVRSRIPGMYRRGISKEVPYDLSADASLGCPCNHLTLSFTMQVIRQAYHSSARSLEIVIGVALLLPPGTSDRGGHRRGRLKGYSSYTVLSLWLYNPRHHYATLCKDPCCTKRVYESKRSHYELQLRDRSSSQRGGLSDFFQVDVGLFTHLGLARTGSPGYRIPQPRPLT